MSRKIGLTLVLIMSAVFSIHLFSPLADAITPDRKLCRAIIKMEGIPASMVTHIKGKVYSFEPDVLNGDSEWPLEKKNGVIGANISLPKEFSYEEAPFNIQTAFLAETDKGPLRCSGEVNVMQPAKIKSPIVVHSTCEAGF